MSARSVMAIFTHDSQNQKLQPKSTTNYSPARPRRQRISSESSHTYRYSKAWSCSRGRTSDPRGHTVQQQQKTRSTKSRNSCHNAKRTDCCTAVTIPNEPTPVSCHNTKQINCCAAVTILKGLLYSFHNIKRTNCCTAVTISNEVTAVQLSQYQTHLLLYSCHNSKWTNCCAAVTTSNELSAVQLSQYQRN